jgi:EAL domain-containing protein (putative c-di-GMP-specific phosphodiesterase class I)
MVTSLGVDLGQGYLLGRPSEVPAAPRPMETLRLDAARGAASRSARTARAALTPARQRRTAD